MNTRELQLGDWVCYRRDFPDKIDGISVGGNSVHLSKDGWQPISAIEPIPLTPEILEKNFKELFQGIKLMYQLKGPYCAMNEDGQWVFGLVKVDGENSARYPLVRILFVHELQHALRLCGIEKEIEL